MDGRVRTGGEHLLAMLDAVIKHDTAAPSFSGTVCVCVRGKPATSYWHAIAGQDIRSGFVEYVPEDSQAVLLIGRRAADSMVEGRRPARRELLETAGVLTLLEDFLERCCECSIGDNSPPELRAARETLKQLRDAAMSARPRHVLNVRRFAGMHRLSFGRASHPRHVTLLRKLVAQYETAPERLAIGAFINALPAITDVQELDTRFSELLLRRTAGVDIPKLSEMVGSLAHGLARLEAAGTSHAHYYAYNRHVDPPVRDAHTWTVFDVIDHVNNRLNNQKKAVAGIQMHIDDGRDGFTLRQLINSGSDGLKNLEELSRRLLSSGLVVNLDCSEATEVTFEELLRLVDALKFFGTRVPTVRFYIRDHGRVRDIIDSHLDLLQKAVSDFHDRGVTLAIENHEDLTSYEVLDVIRSVNSRLCESGSSARLHSRVDFGNDFNCWPASVGEHAQAAWDRIYGKDGTRRLSEADIHELNGIVVRAIRTLINEGSPVSVDVKSVAYWDPITERQGQFGVPAGMGDTPQLLLTLLLLISDNEQLGAFGIESEWGYASPIRRHVSSIDHIPVRQIPSATNNPVSASETDMRRLELGVVENDVRFFHEMLELMHSAVAAHEHLRKAN